ncbi:MAG: hypothetical protein RL090_340 [Bacteroidota bacterium]
MIIGGSTKCGTTSLFNYFEFHPQVCACPMKESRYFLEHGYKLVAAGRDHSMHPEFGNLFVGCDTGMVRMEATPDYLYSTHALKRIASEIPNTKLVFILREPSGRFISWFKYSKQLGLIEDGLTLDEYLNQQSENMDAPQHLRALEQGRYSEYLKKVYEVFSKSNVLICFYEELVNDPKALCDKICQFAGIDSRYFEGYQFLVYNKSAGGKASGASRVFKSIKRFLKPLKQRLPKVMRKRLKLAALQIDNALATDTNKLTSSLMGSEDAMKRLSDYYKDEAERIDRLTGILPPWRK